MVLVLAGLLHFVSLVCVVFWLHPLTRDRVPSGGIASFGPLLVKSFGFDSFQAILFNAPFGLVQLVATLGSAHMAIKYSARGAVIAVLSLAPILGCIIMMSTPRAPEYRSRLLFGYYLISVYPGMSESSLQPFSRHH